MIIEIKVKPNLLVINSSTIKSNNIKTYYIYFTFSNHSFLVIRGNITPLTYITHSVFLFSNSREYRL